MAGGAGLLELACHDRGDFLISSWTCNFHIPSIILLQAYGICLDDDAISLLTSIGFNLFISSSLDSHCSFFLLFRFFLSGLLLEEGFCCRSEQVSYLLVMVDPLLYIVEHSFYAGAVYSSFFMFCIKSVLFLLNLLRIDQTAAPVDDGNFALSGNHIAGSSLLLGRFSGIDIRGICSTELKSRHEVARFFILRLC